MKFKKAAVYLLHKITWKVLASKNYYIKLHKKWYPVKSTINQPHFVKNTFES